MSEFVLQEVPEFDVIPDQTIVEALLDSCDERESKFFFNSDGTPQMQVAFRFRIVEDGPYFDRVVFGDTPTTFSTHTDCKLRMWVQELLAEDALPAGFRFNTDTLVGLPCRIMVAQYETKAGKKGNKVQDVFRAKSGSVPLADEVF